MLGKDQPRILAGSGLTSRHRRALAHATCWMRGNAAGGPKALSEPYVRFEARCGLDSNVAPCPKCANNGSRRQLFDHLVGAPEQRDRDVES
jgi:hypothetical protein